MALEFSFNAFFFACSAEFMGGKGQYWSVSRAHIPVPAGITLLNKAGIVQVSDTTMFNERTNAGSQNKNKHLKKAQLPGLETAFI